MSARSRPGGPPAPLARLNHAPALGGQGFRPAYLGADTEVVVWDKLGAFTMARVEPGVKGAEGHTRERQHEGQEAPSAGYSRVGGRQR